MVDASPRELATRNRLCPSSSRAFATAAERDGLSVSNPVGTGTEPEPTIWAPDDPDSPPLGSLGPSGGRTRPVRGAGWDRFRTGASVNSAYLDSSPGGQSFQEVVVSHPTDERYLGWHFDAFNPSSLLSHVGEKFETSTQLGIPNVLREAGHGGDSQGIRTMGDHGSGGTGLKER